MAKTWWIIIAVVALLTLIVSAIGGWFVFDLRQESTDIQQSVGIVGRVETPINDPSHVHAYLWRRAKEDVGKNVAEVLGSTHPTANGLFVFLAPAGQRDYALTVYNDDNANQRYDSGEAVWVSAADEPITAIESGSARSEVIRIQLSSDTAVTPTILRELNAVDEPGGAVPVVFGEVVDLNDERLRAEKGSAGLWRPASSLLSRGLGVYFLQPYDADRIPVLFVHGAAGTPQDFAWLIEHLDSQRYQPWVFAYPSGLPLSIASDALARMTRGLARQHSIDRMHLIAHSMGGLVARTALMQLDVTSDASSDFSSLVDRFVSISTPWGGHEAVSMGAEHSPVTVPSWFDIKEGSDFINALSSARVNTPHLLIYGHQSKDRFFLPDDNDGSVSVKSQLHAPVKSQATRVEGHDRTHTSILREPAVMSQIHEFLNP